MAMPSFNAGWYANQSPQGTWISDTSHETATHWLRSSHSVKLVITTHVGEFKERCRSVHGRTCH